MLQEKCLLAKAVQISHYANQHLKKKTQVILGLLVTLYQCDCFATFNIIAGAILIG